MSSPDGDIDSLTSMPKVPWITRLGRIGEGEIKTTLTYFCNVTKLENDMGIDFYCELLEKNVPSTPFYVQAKGTEHFDETWGRSIPKSTIAYWLNQPNPVMLVVYDDKARTCYWASIESRRYDFLSDIHSASETIRIQLDRSHVLERSREANRTFIGQIKDDLGSVMLWRGHPQSKGEGYVRELPEAPRSTIELARVEEALRMTSYSLVRYYTGASYDWQKARELCELLAKFDKSHYNHFVWLAQICAVLGDKQAALLNWREALNICERDKVWPKESMDKIKKAIRREIGKIQVT